MYWIMWALSMAIDVLAFFLRAYVLTRLWAWFVMPLGITFALTMPLAMGLSLLLNFTISGFFVHMFFRLHRGPDEDGTQLVTRSFVSLVIIFVAWGTGALIHLWV